MSTIKEVAQRAGVSIATVSRVINGQDWVSPHTHEKVLAAMRDLAYVPNAVARGLRLQRTDAIGVLVPQLDHPFYAALAFAIERALFRHGRHALICSTDEDPEREAIYIDRLICQQVGGLIVVAAGTAPDQALAHVASRGIPAVFVDRDASSEVADRVLVNNVEGGAFIARYLIARGHRRIAVLGFSQREPSLQRRLEGVRRAANEADADIHLSADFGDAIEDHYGAGYQLAQVALRRDPRPTALLCLSDLVALAAMRVAGEMGLSVPGDVSVSGFDDIALASQVYPALTTMAQPLEAIGALAVERVLAGDFQKGGGTMGDPGIFLLGAELRERESVGPPPQ